MPIVMQLDTISIPSLVHTVFACCKLTTSSLDQRVLHRSKTTIYFVSSILQSPSEDRNLPISVWRMSEVFDPRLDLDPHDRTCRILDPRSSFQDHPITVSHRSCPWDSPLHRLQVNSSARSITISRFDRDSLALA